MKLTKEQKRLLPCTIYLLKHSNGKLYVGCTTYPLHRYNSSIQRLCFKHNLKKEDFVKTELEKCDNAKIGAERESYWIQHYGTFNSSIGYNETKNGDGGNPTCGGKNRIHTEASRKNMSNSMQKSKKFKAFSESCKKKISIDGIEYDSMIDASNILKIPYTTISSRINAKTFPTYIRL